MSEKEKKRRSILRKQRGIIPPNQKGKHWNLTTETRMKMSRTAKKDGRKPPSRKGIKLSNNTKQKIREARLRQRLPTKDTNIETILQEELSIRGFKYKKHLSVCNICQPDIVFPEKKIAVFADGNYWHSKNFDDGRVWRKDRYQDNILRENGWKVLRFWGHEIRKDVVTCVTEIQDWFNQIS